MTFWSAPNLEPTRKHRFKVTFASTNINDANFVWWAKSVTKPGFEVATARYTAINHSLEYPGILTWNDVTLVIVDIGQRAKQLYDNLVRLGYKTPQEEIAGGITKEFSSDRLLIEQVNSEGVTIERWNLNNFMIKGVQFGDLSYDDDGLVEITINIAYDWADLT